MKKVSPIIQCSMYRHKIGHCSRKYAKPFTCLCVTFLCRHALMTFDLGNVTFKSTNKTIMHGIDASLSLLMKNSYIVRMYPHASGDDVKSKIIDLAKCSVARQRNDQLGT